MYNKVFFPPQPVEEWVISVWAETPQGDLPWRYGGGGYTHTHTGSCCGQTINRLKCVGGTHTNMHTPKNKRHADMNVKDVNVFSLLTQIFQVSSTLTRSFSSGTQQHVSVWFTGFQAPCWCVSQTGFFFHFLEI